MRSNISHGVHLPTVTTPNFPSPPQAGAKSCPAKCSVPLARTFQPSAFPGSGPSVLLLLLLPMAQSRTTSRSDSSSRSYYMRSYCRCLAPTLYVLVVLPGGWRAGLVGGAAAASCHSCHSCREPHTALGGQRHWPCLRPVPTLAQYVFGTVPRNLAGQLQA